VGSWLIQIKLRFCPPVLASRCSCPTTLPGLVASIQKVFPHVGRYFNHHLQIEHGGRKMCTDTCYGFFSESKNRVWELVPSNDIGVGGAYWPRPTWSHVAVWQSHSASQNDADQCSEPLLRILQVPGSNLDPYTSYSHLWVAWFSTVPPGIAGIVPEVRPRAFPSTAFPITYSLS